jgi:hypothetical protein
MGENALGFFPVKGSCAGCGRAMDTQAKFCIGCFRARCRLCPECINARGKLKPAYRGHRGPKGQEKCPRCGVPHQDIRKITCPRCNGRHFVFVENATA